ncbi:hypothetical protein P869_04735 [Ligilactobacillus ruminis S23]|nr:hypothetical protein P869_04735 [Ligilactobacillus ruminis S23]
MFRILSNLSKVYLTSFFINAEYFEHSKQSNALKKLQTDFSALQLALCG